MFDLHNSFVITKNPYKYNILRTVFDHCNIPIPKIIYAHKNLWQNTFKFIEKYAIPNKLDYFIMFEDDAWPCNDLSGLYNTLNYLSNNNFRGVLSFGYCTLALNPKDIIYNDKSDCIYSDKFIRMGGSHGYLMTSDCYEEIFDIVRNKQTHVLPYNNIEKMRQCMSWAYDISLSCCKNIYFTRKSYFAQLDMTKKLFLFRQDNFKTDTSGYFHTTSNGTDHVNRISNIDSLYTQIFKKFPNFEHKIDFDNINKEKFVDPIFIDTSKI